ncbi:MAG TPA: response regulator transcription factor [Pseudogracilibacillus sp.]|nr:response regulator transcription factor [Pseudogracilibacillus sp.]
MNLAIIDQQHIFREGFQRLVEKEENLQIVASVPTLSELPVEKVNDIDVFLIDIGVLKLDEELITKLISDSFQEKKIVALANEADKENVMLAITLGCHGYLLKDMSYEKFIQALHLIYEQGAFIHPQALYYVINEYRKLSRQGGRGSRNKLSRKSAKRICTNRENEILQLLVDGHNNSSIAKELNISEKTVKNHLTNIFRKLDVKDRTQAAVLAIRNQWVDF